MFHPNWSIIIGVKQLIKVRIDYNYLIALVQECLSE